MNRQQRRAKGLKNSDPAVCLKKSETHSYIDNLVHNDPEVRKVILEEAHRVQLEELKEMSEDLDTLILMSLHSIYGFGRERLLRFSKGLVELQKYYADRYEDCDMFAMKRDLKRFTGIDIAELEKEVEKLAAEESSDKR